MSDSLNTVVAETLGVGEAEIADSTRPGDPSEWDSLANIEIIVGIEDKFGVTIELDEATGTRSVGEWRVYLRNQGVL